MGYARSRRRPVVVSLAVAVVAVVVGVSLAVTTAVAAASGVTVASIAPIEGAAFSGQVATFQDAALKGGMCAPGSDYTATVNWGDKTAVDSPPVALVSGPPAENACTFEIDDAHTYAEERTYSLGVSVSGPNFITPATGSAQITVADAPLSASSTDQTANAGDSFSGTVATFSDGDPAGTAADYSATIAWGDGTSSEGTVSADGAQFVVSGTHTWSSGGDFAAQVSISDSGGATASTSFTATVSGGSATTTTPPPPPPSGPTAAFTVANAIGTAGGVPEVAAGAAVTFDASPSQAPVGSTIVGYRWDFNHDGTYDAMTATSTATFHYYTPGPHSVTLQTEDSLGRVSTSSTLAIQVVANNSGPGCQSHQTFGFLDIGALCIRSGTAAAADPRASQASHRRRHPRHRRPHHQRRHHRHSGSGGGGTAGVFAISLDGGGASLDGLTVDSPTPGHHLILDTRHNQWQLRSDGPVRLSIQNTPVGTITLATLDLQHNPITLPVGGATPDPGAPGMRLFEFQAGQDCSSSPGVVCAQMPGGFPLTGDVGIFLHGGAGGPGLILRANLAMHQPLSISGALTLSGNLSGGVEIDHFGFSTNAIDFGVGVIDNLSLTYDRVSGGQRDVYQGQASAHLDTPTPIGLSGGVRFANGSLQQVHFELTGSVPIGPLVLTSLGGDLGFNPFQIGGNLQATLGPFGFGADVMYTAGNPWHFQVRNANFTYLDLIRVGAQFDLYEDGFVSAGVNVRAAIPTVDASDPVLEVDGTIGGWLFGSQWQVSGGVHARLKLWLLTIDAAAQGFVNSTGYLAGCGHISTPFGNAGGWGWIYLPTGQHDSGAGGCDHIAPYCEVPPPGHEGFPCLPYGVRFKADAAAVPGPQQVQVRPGTDVLNLKLLSVTGVPHVQISGPSGTYTTTTTGQDRTLPFGSMAEPVDHTLYFGIFHPKPGIYTVTPTADSPPVGHLLGATPLPDPHIRVKIKARGHRLRLVYSMRPSPGLRVQFVERGADVGHVIASVTKSHGSIRFVPQDGSARSRRIEAEVTDSGLPQQAITVARFKAPRPTRPGRPGPIRIVRRHNTAVITWAPASGVSAYDVAIRVSDGRRDLYIRSASRRKVVVLSVFPEMSLRVSVAGVGGPGNQPGRARRANSHRLPRARK
jgi:hypothetical protein